MSVDKFSPSIFRKIIGARYYPGGVVDTVRDNNGHGTHTSSTAAGNVVSGGRECCKWGIILRSCDRNSKRWFS
jgi:subtilisin family serine protease